MNQRVAGTGDLRDGQMVTVMVGGRRCCSPGSTGDTTRPPLAARTGAARFPRARWTLPAAGGPLA